jgi:hypothetical protein
MSVFEPRPNEMGAISPKSQKRLNPMGRTNLIGAPHSMVDFGGAVKFGEAMTPKAKAVFDKVAGVEDRFVSGVDRFGAFMKKHPKGSLIGIGAVGATGMAGGIADIIYSNRKKPASDYYPGQANWEARHPEINA